MGTTGGVIVVDSYKYNNKQVSFITATVQLVINLLLLDVSVSKVFFLIFPPVQGKLKGELSEK